MLGTLKLVHNEYEFFLPPPHMTCSKHGLKVQCWVLKVGTNTVCSALHSTTSTVCSMLVSCIISIFFLMFFLFLKMGVVLTTESLQSMCVLCFTVSCIIRTVLCHKNNNRMTYVTQNFVIGYELRLVVYIQIWNKNRPVNGVFLNDGGGTGSLWKTCRDFSCNTLRSYIMYMQTESWVRFVLTSDILFLSVRNVSILVWCK